MINEVIFFNHWHNGDLFISKQYVRILIDRLTSMVGIQKFKYAHPRKEKLLRDLPAQYIDINGINASSYHGLFVIDDVLYVNTWVGAYTRFFEVGQQHSNFITLSKIWNYIFEELSKYLSVELLPDGKLTEYDGVPIIDWSIYDTEAAKRFVQEHKDIVLFCNTEPKSEQSKISGIGTLENTIKKLAILNPNITFVCAGRNSVVADNVFFTDDIFRSVQGGDLNEISYLSTHCKMIIGRSGPWAYCHNKENIMRNDCAIYTISDRKSDSLLDNMYDSNCSHYYFLGNSEDALTQTINLILNNSVNLNKHAIITNDQIINLS